MTAIANVSESLGNIESITFEILICDRILKFGVNMIWPYLPRSFTLELEMALCSLLLSS